MPSRHEDLALTGMSVEESAAVEYANAHYGAEAKNEAARLLVALELEDDTTQQVFEGVSARIDKLDFVEKRQSIEHFRGLYGLLGQTAIGDRLGLVAIPSELSETDTSAEEHEAAADIDAVADPNDEFPLYGPFETDLSPPLKSKLRQNLLVKFFGEENRTEIENLTVNQAVKLATQLGELYLSLKIARATADDKVLRTQQLKDYMEGASFDELSESTGGLKSNGGIGLGFTTMAGSIIKRTEPDQLKQIFDTVRQ